MKRKIIIVVAVIAGIFISSCDYFNLGTDAGTDLTSGRTILNSNFSAWQLHKARVAADWTNLREHTIQRFRQIISRPGRLIQRCRLMNGIQKLHILMDKRSNPKAGQECDQGTRREIKWICIWILRFYIYITAIATKSGPQ